MPNKYALVIGINDFETPSTDLGGCKNDVVDIRNILAICGFTEPNIKTVPAGQEKKAVILQALAKFLSGVAPGDSAVFYMSSHGTLVPLIGAGNTLIRMDRAICSSDYRKTGAITHTEIQHIIDNNLAPGVTLDVIFDCCYSGTGSRNKSAENTRDPFRRLKSRFVEPDLSRYTPDIQKQILDFFDRMPETGLTQKSNFALVVRSSIKYALWSACRAGQVAKEGKINGGNITRGFFTYHFCKSLKAGRGKITRQELDNQITASLLNMRATQVPQTEGTTEILAKNIFT
jgi:metacaspase-1